MNAPEDRSGDGISFAITPKNRSYWAHEDFNLGMDDILPLDLGRLR